ncbi:hypothetical protein [Paraliobacillus zengyii]|uniref:hypothetical protein n=1 Tax=Paraliobacillus zengyii TaxID=2213194 RepID=UPI0013A6F826|nr:hypothetical protein [Paraliobacillus zengyii]
MIGIVYKRSFSLNGELRFFIAIKDGGISLRWELLQGNPHFRWWVLEGILTYAV